MYKQFCQNRPSTVFVPLNAEFKGRKQAEMQFEVSLLTALKLTVFFWGYLGPSPGIFFLKHWPVSGLSAYKRVNAWF
jgi:hypothetical protein